MSDFEYVVGIRKPDGVVSTMLPKQREFFDECKKHRYNLAEGAYGGGKTLALLCDGGEILELYLKGLLPPMKLALCHVNHDPAYNLLVQGLIGLNGVAPRAVNLPGGQLLDFVRGRENQTKRIIYFGPPDKEPCMIYWSGLEAKSRLDEKFKLSGYNFDWIGWSQMDDSAVQESAFSAIRARLGRRSIPNFTPRLVGDCNPAPGWLKRIFIDGDIYSGDDPDEYYHLNFVTEDNVHTDEKYKSGIRNAPSEAYRKRYYLGLWDDFEGMVYEQLSRQHSFIRFGDIPFKPYWSLNCYTDWGHYPHPFAGLYSCSDEDGNLFFVDEVEFYRHTARQAADVIRTKQESLAQEVKDVSAWNEIPPKFYGRFYGPPDLKRTQGDGRTLIEQMFSDPLIPEWRGVVMEAISAEVPKSEREKAFINSLQELMVVDPEHRNPLTGELGAPRIYIASDRCKRLIAQLTTAQHDPDKPGKILKTEQRNPFAPEDGAIHHWDIHDCAQLSAQHARMSKKPREEREHRSDQIVIQKRRRKESYGWD